MPVLSRGVVASTLGLLVAASYLLLNTNEKRLFFTPTGSREDTAVRKMPSSSPICKHLIVQSLCKKNNANRNRLLDRPTIILNFRTIVLKTAQKRLLFTSKWTTAWHHSLGHALLNTHLPSFDSPIAMKEQRPSSETPAWRSGDRPELSGRLP